MRIGRNLRAGVGLVRGGAGTAFEGSPANVALALREYQDLGVETFIFSGHPHLEGGVSHGGAAVPGDRQSKSDLSTARYAGRDTHDARGARDRRTFQFHLKLLRRV